MAFATRLHPPNHARQVCQPAFGAAIRAHLEASIGADVGASPVASDAGVAGAATGAFIVAECLRGAALLFAALLGEAYAHEARRERRRPRHARVARAATQRGAPRDAFGDLAVAGVAVARLHAVFVEIDALRGA